MKKYVVTKKQSTGSDVLAVTLRPVEAAQALTFAAGQYVAVGFRRGSQRTPMRCFSVTTAPNEAGEIGIAFRTAGNFTNAFADATVGSTVDVAGPFGEFTVSYDENRPLVFLAGGIGITPFLSLLHDLASHRMKQPVTLLYSCRSLRDVPFAAELMELARENSNFTVRFLIDTVPPENKAHPLVLEGKLTKDILRQFSEIDSQYYICGPAVYAAMCQGMLEELSVNPASIYSEAFSQSSKMKVAGFALQKVVYALFAATVLAGALLLLVKDSLKPKTTAATTTQATTTSTNPSTSQAATDYTTTPTVSDTTTTTPSTTTSTTPSSTSSSSSTSQQTYYYQPPVTRGS
jgi:ferredoxin-NADP reductase